MTVGYSAPGFTAPRAREHTATIPGDVSSSFAALPSRTFGTQPALRKAMKSKRQILVIEYDVTGLSTRQIDRLMLEAVVQAEASDDAEADAHPDVPVITTKIIELKS